MEGGRVDGKEHVSMYVSEYNNKRRGRRRKKKKKKNTRNHPPSPYQALRRLFKDMKRKAVHSQVRITKTLHNSIRRY